jgi:hypothetical protein
MRGDTISNTITVKVSAAPVYVTPAVMPTPLVLEPRGVILPVIQFKGEWVLIEFADQRWGPRRGYIHCSNLSIPTTSSVPATSDAVTQVTSRTAPKTVP